MVNETFRQEQEKIARKAGKSSKAVQEQNDEYQKQRSAKKKVKVKEYLQGMKDAGHIRGSKYLDEE